MFVPSLSWQNDAFLYRNGISKMPFFAGKILTSIEGTQNATFCAILFKLYHFTKTGSGQT